MSAVTITPANVTIDTAYTVNTEIGTAGAAITAGACVYKDSSGLYQLSDANGAAALRVVDGIALNGAAASQPLTIAKEKSVVNIGGTLVAGGVYVAGATAAGDINPVADLTTGWYTTVVGVALTTGKLRLICYSSGVVN
jgi:hypothetical protein